MITYKTPVNSITSVKNFMIDDKYDSVDYNQMPNRYNINDLQKDLLFLKTGVENAQLDTIKTNLNNALLFIAEYFDLIDSPAISIPIINLFVKYDFMNISMEILANDNRIDDISCLLELLVRLFEMVEHEHPLQQYISQEMLILIMNIVVSPSSILTEEERNSFSFENISLTSLFGTTNNIPVETYDNIRILGLEAILKLCYTRNDLMEFTLHNICPVFYDLFIEKNDENPEIVIETVKLYTTIISYYCDESITVEELIPFARVFIMKLILNNTPLVDSIYGLIQCVSRNPSITDELVKTPLFENINFILRYDSEEIIDYTLILISEMFSKSSKNAKDELIKFINWDFFNEIGQKTKSEKILFVFCRTNSEILHYTPMLAEIMYDKRILDTITMICSNSSYETRDAAFKCFLECISLLDSERIHQIISQKTMVEALIEFLFEEDDEKSILILKTLSYILQVGVRTTIIKELSSNGLFKQIEDSVELILNVENPDLFQTAQDFYDEIQICKQQLEEFREVGAVS